VTVTAMTPTPILILRGSANADTDHWQSHWERADPACGRVVQDDWLEPRLADWLATLDRYIRECDAPPILVAHSLACALVAHWAARNVEGRHGSAGASRGLGSVGGHVGAARDVEGRHGSAGAFRALGGVGGHVGAPH